MNKIAAAKQISKFVVGGSVSFTVANVLRNNVNPASKTQNVEAILGSMVVGAMVAEKAEAYTSEKIDEIVAFWNENVKKTK